jgi:exonuclease SbcC
VTLRFEIDGQVWEAVRNLRRRGQAQHALYRYASDDGDSERVEAVVQERPMGERVEQLLGLDYAAFSRSVLLAQGEFDRFLRAGAAERDRVLKGVFGLDRVDRIRELAKERNKEGEHELELIGVRLEAVERAQAELPGRRQALVELGQRIALLEKAEPKLTELAERIAEAERALVASTERAQELERLGAEIPDPASVEGLEEAARSAASDRVAKAAALESAHQATETAEQALKAPDHVARVAALESGRDALARLSEARRAHSTVAARLANEQERAALARDRAAQSEAERIRADAVLVSAATELEARRRQADAAEAAVHAARHADMAAALRRGLEVGDPCPVCGQAVTAAAPERGGADLEEAEETAQAARKAFEDAGRSHTAAAAEQKGALKSEEERLGGAAAADELAVRTAAEVSAARSSIEQVEGELAALLGPGDPEALLDERRAEVEARGREAEEARSRREEARRLHDLAIQAEQQGAQGLAEVRTRLSVLASGLGLDAGEAAAMEAGPLAARIRADWEAQAGDAAGRRARASAAIESAKAESLAILDEVGLEAGGFERALAEARAESGLIERQVIEAEAIVEGSEADLVRKQELSERGELLRRVAADLTDAKFVRFLLEGERTTLAAIGSEHFQRLSSGRYRFTEDGEFMVADLASADATRRADSLSGGETFLASLGLALGLAEMVGREGGRLDAFFLDEGFGTLDAEHLDLAMEGIEELVNDRRLVVVVSHTEGVRSRIDDLIVLDRDALTGDSIVRAGAGAG